LILGLVFLGFVAYTRLNVERWPNVDIPIVVITVQFPGASPEEMESDITDKIEAAVNTVSGIDRMTSTSADGFSIITVQFLLEKNIDVATQEVQDKVSTVVPDLPQGIDPPVVSKFDIGAAPVATLALSGDRPIRDITEYADKVIRPKFEGAPGVGQIDVIGGRARQINVLLDPERLNAYALGPADVVRAMQTQNVQIPAGNVDQGAQRLTLRTLGRVASLQELEAVVVATRGGQQVRVADVARVEDGAAEAETTASVNGRTAVLLLVRKQSGANTLNVVSEVKARLATVVPGLAGGYRLELVRDQAVFVEASTHSVQEHLIVGSILAALVVLLFLWDGRSMIIAAIAIPTSLISTFALLGAMGLTLNIVTLLALALVVGIVIDDAIVVLENIYKFMHDKGMSPMQAAIEGTRQVGTAVTATTFSLIAVFLPLAFMGGIVGRFMRSFGWTMAFAIAVSLLVSFTLTPALTARWLSRKKRPEPSADGDAGQTPDPAGAPVESHRRGRITAALEGGYHRLLAASLRRRWVVATLSLVTLLSIGPLGAMVNQNFLPEDDESQFDVVVRAPEGWTLDATARLADGMATAIRGLDGVQTAVVTVGNDPQRTANRFTIFVRLTEVGERPLSQHAIMERVRAAVLPRYEHLGLRTIVAPANDFGEGGAFQPIEYVISGPDLAVLTRVATEGERILRAIPGVVDVNSSLVGGKPQLGISIDRARAADLGVSVQDAATALRVFIAGVETSQYAEAGEQYDINVQADTSYRHDVTALDRLTIGSAKLGNISLSQVIRTQPGTGPSSVERFNQRRQATLTAGLLPGTSQAAVLTELDQKIKALALPAEYVTALSGQAQEQGRQAAAFMTAFGLSFVFMYLVLAAQFESWLHPITILLSLPLTVPFALLSIIAMRGSVNIITQLGILVLFGVVKKNSILQIDRANQLREQGVPRDEAILRASGDRLRPILMTTIAFVAGMIPLAISTGVGAETNRAISSVIIGGQMLSLVLTLVAIPVFYSLFDDLARLALWSRAVTPGLRLWERVVAEVKTLWTRPRPVAAPATRELSGGNVAGEEGK
jgi:HAE1 family hydrophobic/amphiphilic exporter-1